MNKRLIICFITVLTLVFPTSVAFATPRDIQYHWAGTAANTLIENGIMNNYADGRFKPDKNITEEEFSALLASFGESKGFVNEEIQGSLPENFSRPQKDLTREEMAQMLYDYMMKIEAYLLMTDSALGGEQSYATLSASIDDIKGISGESAILYLCDKNIINGYEDGTFRPKNKITRGEVAAILYRMSDMEPVDMVVDLPRYNLIEAPYISQLYPVNAPVGCEGTSLLMGLKSKGYAADIDLKTFLDAMPKDTQNPSRGFVGSPYTPDRKKKTRTTIFPSKLSEFGRNYGTVTDMSGSSVREIQAEILAGNPVIAYATMNWENPFYREYDIDGESVSLLSNNHVILVTGYDSEKKQYFICDPYNVKNNREEFKYWIDGATFERIYNARKHAVAVE